MPEQSTKVQSYRVDYLCDECGEGKLEQTGMSYPVFPPLFEHRCAICGTGKKFRKTYPHIEHREE